MPTYRPAFEAALRLFAQVSEAMLAAGRESPVGGAAVEIYSLGTLNTGDFDIVTGAQPAFEAILQDHGFIRPAGPNRATRGWIHPDLQLGFEVVSSTLLDGQADRHRVRPIRVGDSGTIHVIAIEDMVADRMGQYASGTAREMLQQARTLSRKISISIIWKAASATKRPMIMVSKTSTPEPTGPNPITLEELGRQIARRRAELGITDADLPRNSGARRTESKKALLKAIKDIGGNW
jgi:hypothetical protein